MYICNAITPTVVVNKAFANNNVHDPRPTAWIKILKIEKGVYLHNKYTCTNNCTLSSF